MPNNVLQIIREVAVEKEATNTPNSSNSSMIGLSTSSVRSKLNPKSSVYNANQNKASHFRPDNFTKASGQNQINFNKMNTYNSRSEHNSNTQVPSYNQNYLQFGSGLVSSLKPKFLSEENKIKQFVMAPSQSES